jgi:hypothetical protein
MDGALYGVKYNPIFTYEFKDFKSKIYVSQIF